MASGSGCFTKRDVILPDPAKAVQHATNGQAGRDIVSSILDGRTEDALLALRDDPKLAHTQIGYDPQRSTERPQGQYGDLLTLAVSRCDLAQLNALLDGGLPVDGAQRGEALGLALLADAPEMAELLLQRGASPDPQQQGGANVMQEITGFNHVAGVMTLLRHGLDLGWQDRFGNSHLHVAVDMENYQIAELLIAKGANPWLVSGAGAMPVQQITEPLIIEDKVEDAARARLAEKLRVDAKTKGLPWPPPKFADVRRLVLAGGWPTTAMSKAGGPTLSAIARDDMERRFGPK
jgi:Ankyrin repeats (3 copies)